MKNRIRKIASVPLALIIALLAGCNRHSGATANGGTVVLYTSVDQPYVLPVIEDFQKQTGITVTLVTDSEASKSVGLAEKLRAEKDHPQADVWWSNECFLTINLADEGVLAPYDSPSATDIPAQFKDADHRWAGSIVRVRTLVSSASPTQQSPTPTRLRDLLRPDLKNRIAIARPTAGTTGGHLAALYVLWGKDRVEQYFHGLHDNGVTLVGGNSVVAGLVAKGDMTAGICDNDDAADANENSGGKLIATLPDQDSNEDGTLAMPCTVGLVSNDPHPAAAKRLIDFLLSRQIDQQMVNVKFAWCSTRDMSDHGKFMVVDYHAVAKAMPGAIRSATAILEGR